MNGNEDEAEAMEEAAEAEDGGWEEEDQEEEWEEDTPEETGDGQAPFIKAVIIASEGRTQIGLQREGTDPFTRICGEGGPAGLEEAIAGAGAMLGELLEEAQAAWLESPRHPAHQEPERPRATAARSASQRTPQTEQGALPLDLEGEA